MLFIKYIYVINENYTAKLINLNTGFNYFHLFYSEMHVQLFSNYF